jgi:hypothetical protein
VGCFCIVVTDVLVVCLDVCLAVNHARIERSDWQIFGGGAEESGVQGCATGGKSCK